MKVTIEFPEAALADAMRHTGEKTERGAVVKVIDPRGNEVMRIQSLEGGDRG